MGLKKKDGISYREIKGGGLPSQLGREDGSFCGMRSHAPPLSLSGKCECVCTRACAPSALGPEMDL